MKNIVLKNVLQLASGTLISQILLFGATPILTRLYTPEDFGVFTIFTSISALLAGCLTLKLEAAIPLPRDEGEAMTISRVALQLSLMLSGLVCFIFVMAYIREEVVLAFLLMPLSTCLAAYITIQQQWCTRLRNYSSYAASQVIASMVNISGAITLGVLIHSKNNLVACLMLGVVASALFLRFKKPVGIEQVCFFKKSDFAAVLKKYRRFPLYLLPTALILSGAQYIQPLLIGRLTTMELTGLYSISNRVVMVPVIIVGGAIAESLKSEFIASLNDNRGLIASFNRASVFLCVISVTAILLIFLLSDYFFPIVFGNQYSASSDLAKSISIGVFSIFMYQSFYFIFTLLNKNKLGLFVQVLITGIPLIFLSFITLKTNLVTGLYAWSISTCLLCTLGIIKIRRLIAK